MGIGFNTAALMLEQAASLAEKTIVVLKHGGSYSAEEVNELLARQRKIIADRIRAVPE